MCAIEFQTGLNSNMAARSQSWIFFRAHYLKNIWSNWFEIFIGYWYLSEDVCYWILGQSKIQIGHQAAILDFHSRALSREQIEAIDLKFLQYIGTYKLKRMCAIKFQAFLKSNMAARLQSWIFFCLHYLKNNFSNRIRNFYRILVHLRGCALSIFRPVWNPIWPPGRNLGFSFACIISRTIEAIDSKF